MTINISVKDTVKTHDYPIVRWLRLRFVAQLHRSVTFHDTQVGMTFEQPVKIKRNITIKAQAMED